MISLSPIPIIILFIAAILLVTAYFIARVHIRQARVGNNDDIISVFFKQKQKEIDATNSFMTLRIYILLLVTMPFVFGILMYLYSHNAMITVAAGIGALFFPKALLKIIVSQANKDFESRYARSLEQLSSSLRAGLSLMQAVDDVANCKFVHASMRKKYAQLSSDLRMGLPVGTAFTRFAEGTNSQDAKDVAMAIIVQNEVGGHEADVVQEIAENIKKRIALRREISSIFSSTSSMVWMMDFIPYMVFAGFAITNPQYLEMYLSKPLYTLLFAGCLILPAIGSITEHSILRKVKKGA